MGTEHQRRGGRLSPEPEDRHLLPTGGRHCCPQPFSQLCHWHTSWHRSPSSSDKTGQAHSDQPSKLTALIRLILRGADSEALTESAWLRLGKVSHLWPGGCDLFHRHSWISEGASSYSLTTWGPPSAMGSQDDLSSFPGKFLTQGIIPFSPACSSGRDEVSRSDHFHCYSNVSSPHANSKLNKTLN